MSNPENRSIEPEQQMPTTEAIADEIPALNEQEKSEKEKAIEDFDYVVPAETYKNHHKKHRHKKRKKKETGEKHDLLDEAVDGYVFANPAKKKHHRHRKKIPVWAKIIIIVVSVILVIGITLGSAYFIMKDIGRKAMHNYDDIDISIPLTDNSGKNATDIRDKGRTIKYGGKTYLLNEDVMSVVFVGYNQGEVGESDNYMGDAIYIIAIDANTGKTTVIGVSRDTMLDVNIYSADGEFIDTEKTQLAYAYSYGNDKVKGGQNVNTALSRLFFGLPFNNYFAIDLDALKDLNDAIGGVTLTSLMEFYSEYYGATVLEGEEITLHGKDAETYIRSRDIEALDSNNARMDRQQQYIKAFLSSIIPAAKKDIGTVTNLYGVVSDNADTTLDLPKITYLATTALTKMRSSNEIEYLRLSGKIKEGEHAEMYLDDKDVLETMLKVFYKPVE